MTIAETTSGTFFIRSAGGIACLATWQCTHSMGSAAVNGRAPVEHLIKCDAECVQVAAGIDRAIHASGLFGRHIGEGANDGLGRLERLPFA